MYKVNLPLRVQLSKNAYFSINLNTYRNTHYQALNKAKIVFKEIIATQLAPIPYITSCKLTYILYPKTKHLQDVSNICSIADKFFCDAMTELGKWEDDNYTVIKEVTYKFGSIDKDNPRVEVIIELEENPMQIKLVEKEIIDAIKYYVTNNVGLNVPANFEFNVNLVATRGSSGITAEIDLNNIQKESKTSEEHTVDEYNPAVKITKSEEVEETVEERIESEPNTERKSLFGNLKRPIND